ncbi:unnamed protein product [Lathyrus oleraceus]
MTFSSNNFYTVFMIFLYLVILFIFTREVEARLCGKPCKTWGGHCLINSSCNAECTDKEQAIFGMRVTGTSMSTYIPIGHGYGC